MDDKAITSRCYLLDAQQSDFTVQAFASGLFAGFGHNPVIGIRDFSGVVRIASDAPTHASLHCTVNANSLAVLSNVKENDRQEIEQTMFDNVLEVHKYPEYLFSEYECYAAANYYRPIQRAN